MREGRGDQNEGWGAGWFRNQVLGDSGVGGEGTVPS
jgi:hypothetical protein